MKKPTTMEGASREEVKEDAVANAVETVKEGLLKLQKKHSAYAEACKKKLANMKPSTPPWGGRR